MSTSNGIIYLLSGTSHAVRLVISLVSLRQQYQGSVTVFTTDNDAAEVGDWISGDPRLNTHHVRLDQDLKRRKGAYLFKTRLHEFSPYDVTAYLDCDTVVTGSLDELFEFQDARQMVVTQFCDWVTTGRIISGRIRSWKDTHPELVEPALQFGPAINTGIFAFTRQSEILKHWSSVTERGKRHFIPDEVAMQLLVPQYPCHVLDGRFNCSCIYGELSSADVRVIHFHGGKHIKKTKTDRWLVTYESAIDDNIANLKSWTPSGDKRLASHLEETDGV